MVRVFLLLDHSLFGQGIESLLSQDSTLEIVGREADLEKALTQIKVLRPDVVFIDNGDLKCDPMLSVARILREQGGANIIGLNLMDNVICIYHDEHRVVTELKDLVEAIKYISPSGEPEHPSRRSSSHGATTYRLTQPIATETRTSHGLRGVFICHD